LRDGGFDLDFRSSVFTGVGEVLFTEWKGWYYTIKLIKRAFGVLYNIFLDKFDKKFIEIISM